MITTAPKDINSYLAAFPEATQRALQQIRNLVQETVPEAKETIKYGMPTFIYHGDLVHFAAFVHHIGFYSVPTSQDSFTNDLQAYKVGNGSVQFPLNQPLPLALIRKIVTYRAQENLEAALHPQHA
ncbi:hypothetical protein GU926_11540 [Nibribacter ruber]|uniref:YdhG-like domain-containing protein n=1 Tax=Nibribacter ruber TaxID=2698458 RepID=A0A6P1P0T2_9BACT|nr:DUF1801 domain-containing protein [Nibribacter ruber]QHL88028.1 hypothetical protein GU926_11540 [Nibribacter ruber]